MRELFTSYMCSLVGGSPTPSQFHIQVVRENVTSLAQFEVSIQNLEAMEGTEIKGCLEPKPELECPRRISFRAPQWPETTTRCDVWTS